MIQDLMSWAIIFHNMFALSRTFVPKLNVLLRRRQRVRSATKVVVPDEECSPNVPWLLFKCYPCANYRKLTVQVHWKHRPGLNFKRPLYYIHGCMPRCCALTKRTGCWRSWYCPTIPGRKIGCSTSWCLPAQGHGSFGVSWRIYRSKTSRSSGHNKSKEGAHSCCSGSDARLRVPESHSWSSFRWWTFVISTSGRLLRNLELKN